MARALTRLNARVVVCTLGTGERFEGDLLRSGIPVESFGRRSGPLLRVLALVKALARFRPHIIQSAHAFTNLYAVIAARLLNAVDIGCLRSSVGHCREANGKWTGPLLRWPSVLVVNSWSALGELQGLRASPSYLVPNYVAVNQTANRPPRTGTRKPVVISVGRLTAVKRTDRFLRSFATACIEEPSLVGIVVGDGPERPRLERQAAELGLGDRITFLGERADVPELLDRADMFALSSDSEGCPNVVLEAMARRLPVVSTPAGDVPRLIDEGVSGYLVPFDDTTTMAERFVRLARNPNLRSAMGTAGYERSLHEYSLERMIKRLVAVYQDIGGRRGSQWVRQPLGTTD